MLQTNKKPLTRAQEIFGLEFGNLKIINERPDELRSSNHDDDKRLFTMYRTMRKESR